MRMLALTRYGGLGASSRLRGIQYFPSFNRVGIEVRHHALLSDEYVRGLYSGEQSMMPVLRGYAGRIRALFKDRHDLVFLEKEVLPWIPAVIELACLGRSRLVVDYDDAVFHNYDQHSNVLVREALGRKLDRLMRRADLVTVGNAYLHQRASSAGSRRVERVPTVIDLNRYQVKRAVDSRRGELVVGWIGSPATAKYLERVSVALNRLRRRHRLRCVAIGAREDQVRNTPFQAVQWAEESEASSLMGLDIGIMPLPDAPWERGKCGYKLIQYMACGLPVVASPVGVNKEIVRHGENGFLAESVSDWENSLERLIADSVLRARMGASGRAQVEQEFCLQVQGPRLARMLLDVGSL